MVIIDSTEELAELLQKSKRSAGELVCKRRTILFNKEVLRAESVKIPWDEWKSMG